MKFKYVFLMLFILIFSNPAFSETTQSDLQKGISVLGNTATSVGAAGQAGQQTALAKEIAEVEEKLIDCGVNPKKCKEECAGLNAKNTATTAVSACTSAKCDKLCSERKSLKNAKLLNMNSLLMLLGETAKLLSAGKEEDKRTCPQKCPDGQEAKLHSACLKANTNEYGESCDYTIPAGKCDDTDPIVVKDLDTGKRTCDSWTGGCDLYKLQCACNLRAEQTKQPLVWDDKKNDCVKQQTETPDTKENVLASADEILTPDKADLTAKEEAKADKAAAAAAGTAGLGGATAGATGAGAKNAKTPLSKKDAKLTAKDTAPFKDVNYSGPAGESGGTQGTTSGKKATDIAGSKDKNGLFETIHQTYTDYKDAGRFLSADFKSKDAIGTKKSKHITKKG